jgi:para-nitrobenzyl esterase
MRPEMGNATAGLAGGVVQQPAAALKTPPVKGAVHSAEIEYTLEKPFSSKLLPACMGSASV